VYVEKYITPLNDDSETISQIIETYGDKSNWNYPMLSGKYNQDLSEDC